MYYNHEPWFSFTNLINDGFNVQNHDLDHGPSKRLIKFYDTVNGKWKRRPYKIRTNSHKTPFKQMFEQFCWTIVLVMSEPFLSEQRISVVSSPPSSLGQKTSYCTVKTIHTKISFTLSMKWFLIHVSLLNPKFMVKQR